MAPHTYNSSPSKAARCSPRSAPTANQDQGQPGYLIPCAERQNHEESIEYIPEASGPGLLQDKEAVLG